MASLAVLAPLTGVTMAELAAPTAAHATGSCVNSTSMYDEEMGSYIQAASAAAGSTPLDGLRDQGTSGATYSEWNVCQDPSDSSLYSIQNVGTGDYLNDSEGNAIVANNGTQSYNWDIGCMSGISNATFDVRATINEATDNSGSPSKTGYSWVGYGTLNGISSYAFGEKLVSASGADFESGDSITIGGMCNADTNNTITCLSSTIQMTPDDTNFLYGGGVYWNGTSASSQSTWTPCENSTTGEWELKQGSTPVYLIWQNRGGNLGYTTTASPYFDFAACDGGSTGGFWLVTGADTTYTKLNIFGPAEAFDGSTNHVVVSGTASEWGTFDTYGHTYYSTGATSGTTICGYW